MSERFLAELGECLEREGVRGEKALRVLAEARDHLQEAARAGGDATARFGDARSLARLIAAELATVRARRATFATFGALSLAGIGYAAALALVPAAGGWSDVTTGRVQALGPVIAVALVLLPQIAFVAGCLALLRALRLGGMHVVPAAELRLLRRRSAVALAAAGGTFVAFAGFALDAGNELASWWTWVTLALCAAVAVPLVAASVIVSNAASPRIGTEGPSGDVFDDLAPLFRFPLARRLALPEHPWRFAVLCAACVGVLGVAGGWYAEGDMSLGLVRGGFETVALVICFAALGRMLGLRRTRS